MGRQSPRNGYDKDDFEPQAWHKVASYRDRSQGRGDSRRRSLARDTGDRRDAGDWNYDHGWNRRGDSRSRNDYDRSWHSHWKEDGRDWRQAHSRSRPSRTWRRSRDSRPRSRRDSRDGRWRRGEDDRRRSRIRERSRSRSAEASGYGYGYGQSRRAPGPAAGPESSAREAAEFRKVDIPQAKVPKAKPGPKQVARKRKVPQANGEKPKKTIHDPYQLIDPNEPVDHKVIPADGEKKEPEEEPPEERLERLGPKRRPLTLHATSGPSAPSGRRRPDSRDLAGRSPSRSCSLYSYYSYGSYSFSSGWSTPSPRMRTANSRSPSPGWPGHSDARLREVAPGPPPPGPPPGSWAHPPAMAEAPPPAASSCDALAVPPVPAAGPPPQPQQQQYSLHPGPSQPQPAPAWDFRGHPGHYPPHPGHVRPPPPFFNPYPPPHVHFPPGYPSGPPPPPPGYGRVPFSHDIGYGRLEARLKFHHRQGGRKGMRKERNESGDERDGSKTPKRTKKKRRKNRRPKSPGEPPPKWGDTWEEPRSSKGLKLIHEMAPKGLKWKVVLSDESRRSYASFMPSPVPSARLGQFFKTIYGQTDWEQPEGPQGLLPRKTAWMVKSGCQCPYRYGGVTIPPQEFPEWMTELLRTYMPYCGKTEEEWPDSCNVNLYEDGSHAVGWHTDDEALFQSLHEDVAIVSLSLGQPRKFDLRKNWPEDGERVQERLNLGNGALATMEGMLQKHYMHRIARDHESLGPRINLTWRWIRQHHKVCPKSRG